jgi:hypothetical protein
MIFRPIRQKTCGAREFCEFGNLDRNAGIGSAKLELKFVDFKSSDAALESRSRNSELRRRS